MKRFLTIFMFFSVPAVAQHPTIFLNEYWRVSGYGMAFNVEAFDINKDGKKDIIVGNWNDTYVYFGGKGKLDSTVDIVYKGGLLAICDYNGDGFKDLITMHLTKYDSTIGRSDYDGEILFYYGSGTTTLAIDTIPDYSIPLPTKYPIRDEFSLGYSEPGVGYGDFNKDGKADVVIHSWDALPDGVGVLYVYMGNNIPPDSATYTVRGRALVPGKPPIIYYGNHFQVGDINGDGYDDLLLSYEMAKVPPALNPTDSLDVLDVYLGGKNFSFVQNGQSIRYESRVRDYSYSYGWFNKVFSLADINGDGIPDLVINHGYRDGTGHVHFGSVNGIDTIPSFYLTDPDTTRADVIAGAICINIGDFNNDGYDDFILVESGYNSFSLHLGGPRLSNRNPYGLRGLLEAFYGFPSKAIACGDQNGDGVSDFVATASAYHAQNMGYVLMFLGDPTVVAAVNENGVGKLESFELDQNYPNPFNPTTVISYHLPAGQAGLTVNSFVTLRIYDELGRKVITLVDEAQSTGTHKITWNGKDENGKVVSSGAYFYRLCINNTLTTTRKLMLMK